MNGNPDVYVPGAGKPVRDRMSRPSPAARARVRRVPALPRTAAACHGLLGAALLEFHSAPAGAGIVAADLRDRQGTRS